eukprot:6472371-Amphidinium_carterae.2
MRARRPIRDREMSQLVRQYRRERAVATGEEEQEPQRRRPRLIRRKKVRPSDTQQPLKEERRVRPRVEAYEPDLWESADGGHQRIHRVPRVRLYTPGLEETDIPVAENELGDMRTTEAQFEDGTMQSHSQFLALGA